MKPDTTTAKTTELAPAVLKLPAKADNGIYIASEEVSIIDLINNLRNPLTSINMSTEMLSSLVVGDEEKRCLDTILRSSNKIKTLLSDLVKQQDSILNK